MARDAISPGSLYVVFVEDADEEALAEHFEVKRLRQGLFLVQTKLSQSGLYHSIRDRVEPSGLFVGRLREAPKFRNMAPGAVKWLRFRFSRKQD